MKQHPFIKSISFSNPVTSQISNDPTIDLRVTELNAKIATNPNYLRQNRAAAEEALRDLIANPREI